MPEQMRLGEERIQHCAVCETPISPSFDDPRLCEFCRETDRGRSYLHGWNMALGIEEEDL